MNIFKRFKKRNKYKELERLFDEIVILFPKGYSNLMVHNIELNKLDKKVWRIDQDKTAKRYDKDTFDITLFGKDK